MQKGIKNGCRIVDVVFFILDSVSVLPHTYPLRFVPLDTVSWNVSDTFFVVHIVKKADESHLTLTCQ